MKAGTVFLFSFGNRDGFGSRARLKILPCVGRQRGCCSSASSSSSTSSPRNRRPEARNARQFAKLYQGYENTIRVPEIYDELTTSTVLTMEWVDGTRLVDGAELAVYTGDDRAGTRLVDALVQCSLRQMLDSGFFHADPHAGNLAAAEGFLRDNLAAAATLWPSRPIRSVLLLRRPQAHVLSLYAHCQQPKAEGFIFHGYAPSAAATNSLSGWTLRASSIASSTPHTASEIPSSAPTTAVADDDGSTARDASRSVLAMARRASRSQSDGDRSPGTPKRAETRFGRATSARSRFLASILSVRRLARVAREVAVKR